MIASTYKFEGVAESKPKNPMKATKRDDEGFRAMERRLAQAKTSVPMKKPMARPRTSSPQVKSVMPKR